MKRFMLGSACLIVTLWSHQGLCGKDETNSIPEEEIDHFFQHVDKTAMLSATNKRLAPILSCPIGLIESQVGGTVSVFHGASLLQDFLDLNKEKNADYSTISQECRKIKKDLKRKYEKYDGKRLPPYFISNKEFKRLKKKVKKELNDAESIIPLLKKARNGKAKCVIKNANFKVGAIVGGAIGWTRARCTTPLGRRVMLRGPSGGLILGVGIIVSLPSKSYTTLEEEKSQQDYEIPMLYLEKNTLRKGHREHGFALCIGGGSIINNKQIQILKFDDFDNFLIGPMVLCGLTEKHRSLLRKRWIRPDFGYVIKKLGLENWGK